MTPDWVHLPAEQWPQDERGFFCDVCGHEFPKYHLNRDGLCDACLEGEIDSFYYCDPDDSYDYDGSPLRFASAGSALRASSPTNPRNLPCPTCGCENRLTPKDRALGYQCDSCADRAERGYDY